ncbi:hypothetical protein BDZ85DRAFT_281871 [Elsinoe ampelina]|uniref:TauD/TfdA-like domain-containing protein n=1 Tax=Elsinoe ampelina TaxID=302913 RepID=A0A6A6GAU2_9PEZI|nr:hypothetical protein BDZ85DRAFT_281871 [Elsinoe ampelina]
MARIDIVEEELFNRDPQISPPSFTIKPTDTWTSLPIEGPISGPYHTPKHNLLITPLHPTFACTLSGVDWTHPTPPSIYADIRGIVEKHAVVVRRNTSLTDEAHIAFSSSFGELDDVRSYQKAGRTHRLKYPELFDTGDIDPHTGQAAPLSAAQVIGDKANEQFHVDSSFNARRAGHSLLLAHKLPPKGTGGATEFADSRTAYDDLSAEMKERLEGLVAGHGLFHGMEPEESTELIEELMAHVSKPKYRCMIDWEQEGDMIIWDNTSSDAPSDWWVV